MVKDHKGIEYESKSQMCRAYGINVNAFMNRMYLGWTLEKALTHPLKVFRHKDVTVDHLGHKYSSEAEMAKAYGLSPEFLHSRFVQGMNLKDALTKERNIPLSKPCVLLMIRI